MKKTLQELELNIPTIDLLETRKITGGYDAERGNEAPDDGWWHGSPGEENNPYEIPEVVVTPGEIPDPGQDPRENDPQEQEDPDGYPTSFKEICMEEVHIEMILITRFGVVKKQ